MNDDFRASQDTVATAIARSIAASWLRVVINYEMLYHNGGIEHNFLGFSIAKLPDGTLVKHQLELTEAIESAFVKANEVSLRVNKEHWTTCDFVLDSNGKYESKFSYAAPKRINAIFDEDSYFRFGKYLEFYKASQGIK